MSTWPPPPPNPPWPGTSAPTGGPPPKRFGAKHVLIPIGACVGLFLLVGIIGAIFGLGDDGDDGAVLSSDTTTTAPSTTERQTTSTAPPTTAQETTTTERPTTTTEVRTTTTAKPTTTTAEPTTTARPTTTTAGPTQAEIIYGKVKKALGKGNRDADRRLSPVTAEPGQRVVIKWAINENLTEGLTKDTARKEAVDILKAIRDAEPDYNGVVLEGTYSLEDQFGNTSEDRVVIADYDRTTVERINFDNFRFKNVYEIAQSATIHPAFVY